MIRSQHDTTFHCYEEATGYRKRHGLHYILRYSLDMRVVSAKGQIAVFPILAHVRGKPHDVALRLISVAKLIHDSLHVAEQLMGSESC
jgi:hypothetical protein